MEKCASYLSERRYINREDNSIDQKKNDYWSRLLGEDIVNWLYSESEQGRGYFQDREYSVASGREKGVMWYLEGEFDAKNIRYIISIINQKVFFEPFYAFFVQIGVNKLRAVIDDFEECFDRAVYDDFLCYLAEQLQGICMRTLIVEMHNKKEKGLLRGECEKKEYEYFCTEIVGKIEKIKEIIWRFRKNRNEIREQLCMGRYKPQIMHIRSGYSDVHRGGRQVIRVELNEKKEILYKPHTMENEQQFMRLLQ